MEERIVDLQNRKRELANMTIEGKTAAGKLTMQDMMALFGRDAESGYASKHGSLDLKQKAKLLTSTEESGRSPSLGHSGGVSSRERSRGQQTKRVPREEDSVFGRRW